MSFKLSSISLFCFTLAGCIHMYTPPTTGPVAYLKKSENATVIYKIYNDPLQCTGLNVIPRNSDAGLFTPANQIEYVTIPANQWVTLSTSSMLSHCRALISFKPKANQHYEINSRFVSEITCYASITNLSQNRSVQSTSRQFTLMGALTEEGCGDKLATNGKK